MKILVSVLDWGLGHATRTSALVGRLVVEGNDVVLAGSGKSIAMLCNDYPQLRCLKLKSFSPFFFSLFAAMGRNNIASSMFFTVYI